MSAILRSLLIALLLLVGLQPRLASAQEPAISSKTPTKASSSGISELSQLAGRQIWMVNAPRSECDKMAALGMIVDCDQGRETYGMEHEIVIWCQEFDHAIAAKVLGHLGRSDFSARTHVSYPPGTDNSECGQLYEITVRYGDADSVASAPSAPAMPTPPPASIGTITSKTGSAPAVSSASSGGISELSQLAGRQIWMVNAPQSDCEKMAALGMIVDCEQGRTTYGMEHEIVIWCQAFAHAIAPKILNYLGHSNFELRTHATYPEGTDNDECGQLFEITIRYEDAG